MLKTLIKYFKPHRRLFLIDMLCAVTVALIDLGFPLISRYAMYNLLPNQTYKLFFTIMVCVGMFYILRSICYYYMTYLGHTFGVYVEADIRRDLFQHLQDLDFEFYDRNRTGKIMSRLTGDLFDITELAHHGPEDLLISLLTIIGSLIFMFKIQWKLALVVSLLLPIFFFIVMNRRKEMSNASKGVKEKMANINSTIESSISGIKTAKAFSNEKIERNRFNESNNSFLTAKGDFYKTMGIFNGTQEFFMGIMPCVVISFGGFLIMKSQMNYVDLITFTLLVNTFVTPIRKMANFAEIFSNGMAGLRRFDEIMSIQPSIKEAKNPKVLKVNEGEIEFKDIYFSYNDRTEVIEGINLNIKGGETVAIVGHSGGGKTTLCQLLPRFYDVSSGKIQIDGTDIKEVTKKSLRDNIGIVQQDVFIFADTILENIRYGRPDASFEEVVEAARKAEILQDIENMPDKFQTYVGERGTKLSGGQKQRLSIARILLKNPKILILDEATSALDTITEEKIQRSFEELSKGRTTLVIAHRLATVKSADRIVVIDDGKVIEEGNHEELLNLNGEYSKLYTTQDLNGTLSQKEN